MSKENDSMEGLIEFTEKLDPAAIRKRLENLNKETRYLKGLLTLANARDKLRGVDAKPRKRKTTVYQEIQKAKEAEAAAEAEAV